MRALRVRGEGGRGGKGGIWVWVVFVCLFVVALACAVVLGILDGGWVEAAVAVVVLLNREIFYC